MSTAEELKRRVVPLTEPVPSFADSVCSSSLSEESEEDVVIVQDNSTIKSKQLERRRSSISNVVNSTFLRKRLSRQSSLPWGHRRSKLIGSTCFAFLLPIPLLLKSCCPFAAFMLAVVTVSSFSSDYVYTGVESRSHLLDRALAPVALITNIYAIYGLFGPIWPLLSVIAVKCHIIAMYYSKHNNYQKFVIFHSLWHLTGVGLILLSFAFNGVRECGIGVGTI